MSALVQRFLSTRIDIAELFRLYLKFILGLLNFRREIVYLFLLNVYKNEVGIFKIGDFIFFSVVLHTRFPFRFVLLASNDRNDLLQHIIFYAK